VSRIRELAERQFRGEKGEPIKFKESDLAAALLQVAHESPYHPVSEYLRALKWDGESRLDLIVTEILGVPADKSRGFELQKTILRRWFIAAVARGLSPGCKQDVVLVLAGPQGAQKSTFLSVLAGDLGFSDTAIDIHNKDSVLLMRRVWIYEWAELEQVKRARDRSQVRGFISSATDSIRPPYARSTGDYPRSSIIAATTNDDDFIEDTAGERRFWPLRIIGRIDIDKTRSWRDHLWAEAVTRYGDGSADGEGGEQWWLRPDEEVILQDMQKSFAPPEQWAPVIMEFLKNKTQPVNATDILAGPLRVPMQDVGRGGYSSRIGKVLSGTDWKRSRRLPVGGQKITYWFPPEWDQGRVMMYKPDIADLPAGSEDTAEQLPAETQRSF
jgi:predicted P-loop ATPase